jgi:aspartate/methionine/tyrosine aminotransferase
VVTVGASGAFVLTFLAAFDPGDRVVVPEPAFPAYKNTLRALGVEAVRLGLGPETAFKPTAALLAALDGRSTAWSSQAPRTRPARCCSRASSPSSPTTAAAAASA